MDKIDNAVALRQKHSEIIPVHIPVIISHALLAAMLVSALFARYVL
jgi:hypothetical protein